MNLNLYNITRGVGVRGQAGSPPSIIEITSRRGFLGDSQTDGRAYDTPSAVSHQVAFTNIWSENSLGTVDFNGTGTGWGVGSRSLQETLDFIDTQSLTDPFTFFIQESGDQDNDGQRTSSEFATTLYNGIVALKADYPLAMFFYETAFSFGRKAEAYRNWDSYNAELPGVVSSLAGVGITLHIVPVCAVIEELETVLTPSDVWLQAGHPQQFHFTGLGNFAVAMTHLHYQGHDITTLAHTSIIVDGTQKQAAIDTILAVA